MRMHAPRMHMHDACMMLMCMGIQQRLISSSWGSVAYRHLSANSAAVSLPSRAGTTTAACRPGVRAENDERECRRTSVNRCTSLQSKGNRVRGAAKTVHSTQFPALSERYSEGRPSPAGHHSPSSVDAGSMPSQKCTTCFESTACTMSPCSASRRESIASSSSAGVTDIACSERATEADASESSL